MSEIQLERGEDKCAECGAYIRNIVRIDGVPLGTTCAEAFLPRNATVRAAASNFSAKLEKQEQAEIDSIKTALFNYARTMPLSLLNRPDAFYANYLDNRFGTPFYLQVQALVAYRQMHNNSYRSN